MSKAGVGMWASFLCLGVAVVLAVVSLGGETSGSRATVVPEPTTGPSSQAGNVCSLRLSEVKLDGADGSDDWWVELYNASDQDYDAVGVTIVVNNKIVAEIGSPVAGKNPGAPAKVPGRGLLLIQVDLVDTGNAPYTVTTRPKSNWAPRVTVVPPGPKEAPYPKRTPGYCALFNSPKLVQEALVDYVQWGRVDGNTRRSECPHGEWAAKRELWYQDDAVPIGLRYADGEFFPPPLGSSISRHMFSSRRIGRTVWIVCAPRYATPGACNAVPPPIIHSPLGGHAADGPLQVGFLWRDIPPMIAYGADVTAEKPYHFQIAADAVFEEIVFDSRYDGGAQSIAQGRLKPGSYWARVRYDSPRLSTDWSETKPFTYR